VGDEGGEDRRVGGDEGGGGRGGIEWGKGFGRDLWGRGGG